MKSRFTPGKRALFSGEIKRFGVRPEVHHPDVDFLPEDTSVEEFVKQDPLSFGRILPIYPLTEGVITSYSIHYTKLYDVRPVGDPNSF